MIRAEPLFPGEAEGAVLVLGEPLSFWGAFDPVSGEIVDIHHPQRGARLAGRILLMRESRGSGSAPGALAEAIRRGTAPLAIILVSPDINLAIGAEVAAELYGRQCPILAVGEAEFERLAACATLAIRADGAISGENV
jgi:predicted aconitase with swiveling domain